MLDRLENLLDINFKPDINIENISLIDIDGADRFRKDGRTLEINVEELEPEQQQGMQELVVEQFDADERVLRDDEADEVAALESEYDEDAEDVLEYFDPILSDRYHGILEKSLYLRTLIENRDLSKQEIQDKKAEIARRYGQGAIYLSSLTTAGYFHEDGGLRDLYVQMGLNSEYDQYNFQQELEELVEHKLLCVFVENDDDPYDVTQEVRGRLSTYQDIDPIHDWIDIRGIGPDCERIIDEVVGNLEEKYLGIDYDRWRNDGKLVVRIRPHSIGTIGSLSG